MSKTEITTYCGLAALVFVAAWTGWNIVNEGGLADGTTAPAYGVGGIGLFFALLIGLDMILAGRFGRAPDERDALAKRWGDGFSATAYRIAFLVIVLLLGNAGLPEHANLAFLVFAAIEIVGIGLIVIAYRRMT